MNFYRRRPFVLIITISMLIYGSAAFTGEWIRLGLGGIIILLSFLLAVFLRRRKDFRICGIPSTLFLAVLSVVLLISLLITHAYYDGYEKYYRTLGDNSEVRKLSAEIVSVESSTTFSSVYRIKLFEIDGESVSAMGLVYTEESINMRSGSVVTFEGEFCPLEDFYEYRDLSRVNLLAKGCVFACRMNGPADLVDKVNNISLRLGELRHDIGSKISVYLDRDSAALSNALLLGERSELGRVYRDFTYIGTLHILALSGMHVVIVGGFFEKLMLRLKIKSPIRRITVSILMILYAAVTGFSLSVVRAVLMLLLTNLMHLFKKDIDRITSLFIACGIIILVNPPSIYDNGLQLSFFATLGVLLLTDVPIYDKFHAALEKQSKFGIFIYRHRQFFSSVLASFGAAIFVIPLQWLYYGEMSLLTIPATLILSPILDLLLTLLLPYLAFCALGFDLICKPLSFVIEGLCRLSMEIAEFLGEFSPLISLRYPFVPVIIIGFVIAIIIMMAKNVRGWYKALIPYSLAVVIILAGSGIYEGSRSNIPSVSYTAVKTNDIFAVFSKGESIIIDCTDGSSAAMYEAMEILADEYFTSIDTLLLTKFNSRHIPAVKVLLSKRKVDRIFVPSSDVNNISYQIADLHGIAEEYGAAIIVYNRDKETSFTLGDITISLPKAGKLSRSDRPLSALKLTTDYASLSYVGMSAWEDNYIRQYLSDSEYYIFGMNGPNFKGYDGSILSGNAKYVFTTDETLANLISTHAHSKNIPITIDKGVDITFK